MKASVAFLLSVAVCVSSESADSHPQRTLLPSTVSLSFIQEGRQLTLVAPAQPVPKPFAVPVLTAPLQALPRPPAEPAVQALASSVQPAPATITQHGGTRMLSCSLLGGLISADLSPQCCFSVQVVTQHGLEAYGLAQPCKSSWDCKSDGITPVPAFEAKAKAEMCEEPQCLDSVVSAMETNWMTRKGAGLLAHACDGTVSTKEGLEESTTLFSRLRSSASRRRSFSGQRSNASDEFVACFPGESTVHVRGRGPVHMATLKVGEEVLSEDAGVISFEPVLSFLHKVRAERAAFVTVLHERGVFRATAGHLAFVLDGLRRVDRPVGTLRPDDLLLVAQHDGPEAPLVPSRVSEVRKSATSIGLYAPLTASGTVIVDGVLASIYATPSLTLHLPHAVAHVALWPVRMYHKLALSHVASSIWKIAERFRFVEPPSDGDSVLGGSELHPYLDVCYRHLELQRLLPASR